MNQVALAREKPTLETPGTSVQLDPKVLNRHEMGGFYTASIVGLLHFRESNLWMKCFKKCNGM